VGNCTPPQPILETVPLDYDLAAPKGYGKSKHTSERILHEIAAELQHKFTILRIGRKPGLMQHDRSVWNKNEWFPSLIRTAKELKKLPKTL
jgi:thioester reductase-like protein